MSIYPSKLRVLLRAQVWEAAEGERSTAYFLRQERVRGQQKLINAIRRSDGTVVSSTNDVLGVWHDFYFRLFSSQELSKVDQRPFLDSIESRLTSNESKLCEGDLTIEECLKALSKVPSVKSPGVDGLPAEFYRRFWTLLGPDLVEVYNFCYRHGRLCKSQRQHRRLSYRGRALVACMLGISRFWYLGSTVPVSSDLVPRITRSVFAFVWNNKREWLSRPSASLPPSQGGLGVVNIASKLVSLRVMWVKSFLVGGYHPWKCFFGTSFAARSFPNQSNEYLTSSQLVLQPCAVCPSFISRCWLRGC